MVRVVLVFQVVKCARNAISIMLTHDQDDNSIFLDLLLLLAIFIVQTTAVCGLDSTWRHGSVVRTSVFG